MRLGPLYLLFFLILLPILQVYSVSTPVICIYYYIWYGGPDHPWDDVTSTPMIGYYNSSDLSVISWQLSQIRQLGVYCLFISWWGPGHYTDIAAKRVFELLPEYGLKAALLVEPYRGNNADFYNKSWWNETLSYIRQNYIEKYPRAYFYLMGKPLIIAFNPIGMNYNPSSDFPDYTIRIIGNDIDNAKYQDWDLWPDYDTDLTGKLRIRKNGYVAIAPRFYDEHFRPGGVPPYDPNLTLGWYQKQWNWILENKERIKIIAIYSWNEYHENSAIEPQNNILDAKKPYYLYNTTLQYIQKLHGRQYQNYTTPTHQDSKLNRHLGSIILLVLISVAIISITVRKII